MNGIVTQYWSIIPGGIYQVLYEPITGVDRFNILSICHATEMEEYPKVTLDIPPARRRGGFNFDI